MKKGLLLTAILLLATTGAFAQYWNFGPKIGANFSNVNGFDGAKTRVGVTAGAFADRAITDGFSLEAGLMWSQQGFLYDFEGTNVRIHLNYVNMPIVTKFYFADGFNLQMGAQFGYLVTAKQDRPEGIGLKSVFNKYNADIVTGLGYDFRFGLLLEARYHIGLVNLYRGADAFGADLRNGYLNFVAGWRF